MIALALSQPVKAARAWADTLDDVEGDFGDAGEDAEGGDELDVDGEDESDTDEETGQPPVTAGGLYTLATYPTRVAVRPLTLSQRMWELRAGLGTDLSASQAFKTWGAGLHLRYGLRDHVEAFAGTALQYSGKQFDIYAGLEGAIIYDLLDVRLAFRVNRAAAVGTDGNYVAGNNEQAVDLGFPVRYAFAKEVAVVALQTLMAVEFHTRPDLMPSIAIMTSPLEQVSFMLRAQMVIVDFNTDNPFVVPATAMLQVSPSTRMDLGAEVTFLNLKPTKESGRKFYDDRFATLYVTYRM